MSSASARSARRWSPADLDHLDGVASRADLAALGIDADLIDPQLAADRWQRVGSAIVLHNGPLSRRQRELVALFNCGPRSVFTSFTAAERWGLKGWTRDDVYVLGPKGARRPNAPSGLVLHRTGDWETADLVPARRLHRLAPALLVAAASFPNNRPGCGLLAATVQQRLVKPCDLNRALAAAPRMRHRASLQFAVYDIAQGAQALSEIDFYRLCARHGLPRPRLQAVRIEPDGRRRYLDAEWARSDGSLVAVEVDGALHLTSVIWINDQLRHNEVVIGGTPVLRFPSILVRDDDPIVASQLGRLLRVW